MEKQTHLHLLSGRLKWGLIVIISLLISSGLACTAEASRGLIKVGLVAPFSGRYRTVGYEALFAVRLALREWNARGGVEGYRVLLVAQDDHGQAEMGRLQAEKLAVDEDVLGVVGHPGAASLAGAAPVYADAGLAVLSWGVAELKDEEMATLVRLGPSPTAAAEAVADFATGSLGAKRVAVIVGMGGEDEALAKAVTDALRARGLPPVLQGWLPEGRVDYQELLTELEGVRPEVVFFSGGFAEAGDLLSQAHSAGLEVPFILGFESANADLVRLAGKAAEEVYYLSAGRDPNDIRAAAEFREACQALSGTAPGATALLAYKATNLLLEAIAASMVEGAGLDRKAVSQVVAAWEGRERVSASLAIDDGEGSQGLGTYIYRIEGLGYPGVLVYEGPQGGN